MGEWQCWFVGAAAASREENMSGLSEYVGL